VKRILVISDTHVGSIYGLMPPNFVCSADYEVKLNPGQQYLYECWKDMIARAKAIEPDYVILNGDIVDGKQQAQRGTELNLPIPRDQTSAASLLFEDLKHALNGTEKFFLVQGTEYHIGKAGEDEEVFAERLGCVPYKGLGTGHFSRQTLDLEPIGESGTVINFHHGVSVSSGLYRAVAIDREALWSAIAGKEGKLLKADCIVRAHAHYFVHVEHPNKHAYINPAWQLQTGFMRKNGPYRMLPDIGFTWIEVDGEAKKAGDDPITIHKVIYKLPKVGSTKA
jgi:Calcineurin-like phosphoesterase